MVKILLERDEVSRDKPDNYDLTPLWRAVCCGHERVVKILLKQDEVSGDKPDNYD